VGLWTGLVAGPSDLGKGATGVDPLGAGWLATHGNSLGVGGSVGNRDSELDRRDCATRCVGPSASSGKRRGSAEDSSASVSSRVSSAAFSAPVLRAHSPAPSTAIEMKRRHRTVMLCSCPIANQRVPIAPSGNAEQPVSDTLNERSTAAIGARVHRTTGRFLRTHRTGISGKNRECGTDVKPYPFPLNQPPPHEGTLSARKKTGRLPEFPQSAGKCIASSRMGPATPATDPRAVSPPTHQGL